MMPATTTRPMTNSAPAPVAIQTHIGNGLPPGFARRRLESTDVVSNPPDAVGEVESPLLDEPLPTSIEISMSDPEWDGSGLSSGLAVNRSLFRGAGGAAAAADLAFATPATVARPCSATVSWVLWLDRSGGGAARRQAESLTEPLLRLACGFRRKSDPPDLADSRPACPAAPAAANRFDESLACPRDSSHSSNASCTSLASWCRSSASFWIIRVQMPINEAGQSGRSLRISGGICV